MMLGLDLTWSRVVCESCPRESAKRAEMTDGPTAYFEWRVFSLRSAVPAPLDVEAGLDAEAEAKREAKRLEEEKQKRDAEAMRYLSYALYPLVFCYAVYSLM